MQFTIEFHPDALNQLKKIPKNIRKKIFKKIQDLSQNPYPHNALKLKGTPNFYRIRHSDWRVIYTVQHSRLKVLIVKVGNRKEIYQALEKLPDIRTLLLEILKDKEKE